MEYFLRQFFDWSEVWAPLLPISCMFLYKKQAAYLTPVKIYILIALFINVATTLIWKYKVDWGLHEGDFFWSNNFLYNIHSILRLLLFSSFFILLKQHFMHRVKIVLPFIFILFLIINFSFYENFFNRDMLSSSLFAVEAAMLLFYCLQYFIFLLLEDRSTTLKKQPGFYIVTGLSVYVAASFFIFLFYSFLIKEDWKFAVSIWDVHNAAYIFLCICIAITFYKENVKRL